MNGPFTCAVICPPPSPWPSEDNPFGDAFSFGRVQKTARKNAETALQMAEEAATSAALVVLPEDIHGIRHFWRMLEAPQMLRRLAEPIPGPTTKAAGKIARRNRCFVVVSLYENAGRAIHNTTVLLGPRGKMLGRYRKTHLATGEDWLVTPGSALEVFKTNLGKIGLVCGEDYLVPETACVLARLDAEIVVCPSRCPIPDLLLCSRSFESNFVTILARADGSVLIDQTGCTLAQSVGMRPFVLTTTFVPHPAMEFERGDLERMLTGIEDARQRRSTRRRPELYGTLVEASWPERPRTKTRQMAKTKWEAYGYLSQKWEEAPDELLPEWEV